MWNIVKRILQRVGLKKTEDKFITVEGVRVRVVAEPYPPPKKFRNPPEPK